MGNYMSCTLAKAPGSGGGGGGKCARVILPDGGVRQVPLPATAAELMMDAPGHFLFLVDARGKPSLGARLAALPADAELQLGAVYATFQMKRKGTPLAVDDVARLAAAAEATREARRSSAKVANAVVAPPAALAAETVAVAVAEDAPCRLRLEEMVDDAVAAEIGELKHRASNARSRRPTLETIEEENYMSSR